MSESKIVTMKERDMKKVTSRQRIVKILVQIALYLFLGVMAVIVIFPFYWMIISSAHRSSAHRSSTAQPPLSR